MHLLSLLTDFGEVKKKVIVRMAQTLSPESLERMEKFEQLAQFFPGINL
jgi:hypothetical protein